MKLNELLIKDEFDMLAEALMEAAKGGDNSTVAKWSDCLGMTYDDLHKVWAKAESKAPGKYGIIMTIFKRMLTSVKGITKTKLEACAAQKGGSVQVKDYKIRTSQTMDQLLDDKPAPKSTNLKASKKAKAQISKLNADIKAIKDQNPTAARKARITKLQAKKKEIQASLKD